MIQGSVPLPGWLTSSSKIRWFLSAASLFVPDIQQSVYFVATCVVKDV